MHAHVNFFIRLADSTIPEPVQSSPAIVDYPLLAWIRAPSAIRLVSVAVKEVSCSTVFQMTKGVLFIEVSSFQMP